MKCNIPNDQIRQFGWMFGQHPGLIQMNVIRSGSCGIPEVNIHHNGVTYTVRFDFDYLDKGSELYGDVAPCLQLVVDNPQDQNGDPIQHIRIFPDGKLEMFEA